MAVNGNFLKLYNTMGNYRNLLSSRIILPIYQPVATLKKTIEERAGLPAKPKRPPIPYFRFMRQTRPLIIQKNPDLKVTEIVKLMAQEWQKANEELKTKLQNEYEESMKIYREAKADYYSSITDKQMQQLEMAKLEEKHVKEKKLQEKVIKSLGKPKRPAVGFSLWVKSLGEKRGSMKLADWQKSLSAKWQTLSDRERDVFERPAAEAMNKYKFELKKWEAKMVEIGKHDLIKYGKQLNSQTTGNEKVTE